MSWCTVDVFLLVFFTITSMSDYFSTFKCYALMSKLCLQNISLIIELIFSVWHGSSSNTPSRGFYKEHLQQCFVKTRRRNMCNFCNRVFSCKRDCLGHINSAHLHQKPYMCDICHRCFAGQKTLNNHKRFCIRTITNS